MCKGTVCDSVIRLLWYQLWIPKVLGWWNLTIEHITSFGVSALLWLPWDRHSGWATPDCVTLARPLYSQCIQSDSCNEVWICRLTHGGYSPAYTGAQTKGGIHHCAEGPSEAWMPLLTYLRTSLGPSLCWSCALAEFHPLRNSSGHQQLLPADSFKWA